MKGNGDGKIEIGVVPMADGWVAFREGVAPTREMWHVSTAINERPVRSQSLRPGELQRVVRRAC